MNLVTAHNLDLVYICIALFVLWEKSGTTSSRQGWIGHSIFDEQFLGLHIPNSSFAITVVVVHLQWYIKDNNEMQRWVRVLFREL